MATTRTMKAAIRHENGHQVIVLPDDIQFDGDEVILRQDVDSGDVIVSIAASANHWQAMFAAIDSHGPIPDEKWDAFSERIANARVSRQDRGPGGASNR
jgi:virulence-associated protein VagC